LLSHHQNAGKYDKRSANIIFVTLEQFKYFWSSHKSRFDSTRN
jgi:hypothetical protein